MLSQLVDIAGNLDTRYDAASPLCSRLDGIYVSMPTWQLIQMQSKAIVLSDPADLHARLISDHAPYSVTFASKPRLQPHERPIPVFVFQSDV